MKKFGDSQTVILALIAVGFFMYVASSYSNKKSELLSGFENNNGNYESYDSPGASIVPNEPYTSEPSSLMPNNSLPSQNLLNPDQIIGMKGQVKRNQTYDLRGGIPVPKTKIPFNNSVFMEEDVRTHGMHGSFAMNE